MEKIKKVKGIVLPKDYVLNGRKYQFKWRRMKDNRGLCSNPDAEDSKRIIYINPDFSRNAIIKTIIHEVSHAEAWNLDEHCIETMSGDIFGVLKACGAISQD